MKGRKLSEEHKKKLSEALKGHKGCHHSEEVREKMSLAKKGKPSPRKGAKLSEETKKKISENSARKGKVGTMKGRKHTPEDIAKMRGRKRSAEARKQMSDSHKGKVPWNKGLHSSKVG